MTPADKMRAARGIAARVLGVDELPPDAEVECALGEDGVLHVLTTMTAPAEIPRIDIVVQVSPQQEKR